MHNRKKLDHPLTEVEQRALQEKSTVYKSLVDIIFMKRQSREFTNETLVLLGKVLRLNPDFYSLWNMRREILLSMYPELNQSEKEATKELPNLPLVRDTELQISTEGIRRNPKSCKLTTFFCLFSILILC